MRLVPTLVALTLLAVACSGGHRHPEGPTVEGVVIAVDGDLAEVRSFTVLDDDGNAHTFVPASGLTFHGGPLSHLSSHLTSGEPVLVVYEEVDGELVAVHVDDL